MTPYETNIDVANRQVHALETRLSVGRSEFIENLDAANARIQELEAKRSAPARAPVASPSNELSTLNQRCRQLADCLGFQDYGTYTTVACAQDRIAGLEKLLRQQAQAHEGKQEPKKPQPKPLPNDLAAIQKAGKVFGLGRAMIAAQQQHQKQTK